MFENYHDIITVNELQEILFISRNTAYNLLRSGKIHAFKVGNTWRLLRSDVEQYCGYTKSKREQRFSI